MVSYQTRFRMASDSHCPPCTGIREVKVFRDGHGVSRSSDWIMYSVEAEFIDAVVAEFAPCSSFSKFQKSNSF
jgi:hypothetical protein